MLQYAQRGAREEEEEDEGKDEEEEEEKGEKGDEANGASHGLDESTTAAGSCLNWGDLQVLVESSMCGTASTERKRARGSEVEEGELDEQIEA